MTWKRPIIAAIVAALLFAVYLVDRGASRQETFFEWRLIDFEESTASRLEMQNQHGEVVLEKQGPEQWVILGGDGEELPASIADVRAVIDNLRGAKKGVTFPADNLAEYGLADPPQVVRVVGETDGESRDVTVLFGKDTPQMGQVYAMVEGGDEVFTVGDWVRNQASRGPASLRDKRLLAADPDTIDRIVLTSRNDEWSAERRPEGWWLPASDQPADDPFVRRTLQVLEVLRAAEIDEEADAAELGFDPPLLRIDLSGYGEDRFLEIGDPVEGTEMFSARSSRFPGVATVRRNALVELLQPPSRWGTRDLIWVPVDEMVRIETGRGDSPSMAIVRNSEGDWIFESTPGLPIHPRKLAEFLEAIDALRASAPVTVAGALSDEKLSEYGIRDESFFVRVTSGDGAVQGFRQGQIDFNDGEFGSLFLYREQDGTLWKTDPREAQFYAKVRGDLQDTRIAVGFADDVERIELMASGMQVTLRKRTDRWTLEAPGQPAAVVRPADLTAFLEAAEELDAMSEELNPPPAEATAMVQFFDGDGDLVHFINELEGGGEQGRTIRTPQGQFTVPVESYARFAAAWARMLRSGAAAD